VHATAIDTTAALAAIGTVAALVAMRFELGWLSRRVASRRKRARTKEPAADATKPAEARAKKPSFPSEADTKHYQAVRWERARRRDNESDWVAGGLWLLWAGIFGPGFLVWDPSSLNAAGIGAAVLMLGLAVSTGLAIYASRSRGRAPGSLKTRRCEKGERADEGEDAAKEDER
jgi:hypothetical protein